jgi:hypothetical protein
LPDFDDEDELEEPLPEGYGKEWGNPVAVTDEIVDTGPIDDVLLEDG